MGAHTHTYITNLNNILIIVYTHLKKKITLVKTLISE